ncbi:MAG: calcium-binding protein [Fuerstiella sp.]
MAKPARRKSAAAWTEGLDADAVREAHDDATVDCYDASEQHSGLLTMVDQELQFPFPARVIGEDVTVVDMEWPGDCELGLDLVVEHKGERHRVDARSVEVLEPLPDGHLFLAAYLAWRRFT